MELSFGGMTSRFDLWIGRSEVHDVLQTVLSAEGTSGEFVW